jgi:hypothetical protein
MRQYDPLIAPDPETWLAMDEGERLLLIGQYHDRQGTQIPIRDLHMCVHVIAENQLAMGIPEVRSALERLMAQGLDRHQALHAISTVILDHPNRKLSAGADEESYLREISELTADKWWALSEPEKPRPRVIGRGGGRRRKKRR